MRKYIGQPKHWTRKRDGKVVCRKCHQERTPEGHDPCLGTLSGVEFACCGHGVDEGYVWFESGRGIYFGRCSVLGEGFEPLDAPIRQLPQERAA